MWNFENCYGLRLICNLSRFSVSLDLRRHQQGKGYIQVLIDRRDVDPRPVQPNTTRGHLHIGSPTVLPLHYHYNIG